MGFGSLEISSVHFPPPGKVLLQTLFPKGVELNTGRVVKKKGAGPEIGCEAIHFVPNFDSYPSG